MSRTRWTLLGVLFLLGASFVTAMYVDGFGFFGGGRRAAGGGGGGPGTVTSIDCGFGLVCTPDPIVAGGGITQELPSATDQVYVTDSTSDGTWRTLPDCTDTGGNHLNFTAATNTFSCGTSGTGGTDLTAEPFITKTASGNLTNEFALASLATGALINTTTTGIPTVFGGESCTNQVFTSVNGSLDFTCTTLSLTGAYFANQGTTTTVLHGNAAGNLSFGAVHLVNDVTGLPGSDTQMLFNDGGAIGADPGNVYNKTTNVQTIGSVVSTQQAGVSLNPFNTAGGNTGELRFYELAAGGSNYRGFKAGDTLTGDLIWVLPTTDSTGTQCLSSNGSGILSWSACSGGSGTPGGADTQVQFNDGGAFGGDAGNVYNKTTNVQTVGSVVSTQQAGLTVNPFGAGAGETGETRWLELAAGGSNYVALKSGDARAGNITYVWPTDDPTAGQILSAGAPTGGVSILDWVAQGGIAQLCFLGGDGVPDVDCNEQSTYDILMWHDTNQEWFNSDGADLSLCDPLTDAVTFDPVTAAWSCVPIGAGGGLGDPGANGVVVRTALDTTTARTITGTTDLVTITNGDGVAGNPTITLAAGLVAAPFYTTTAVAGLSAEVVRANLDKDRLILPITAAKLPSTNFCEIDTAETNNRLLCDATTSESATWQAIMPQTYGTSLTARIAYSMTSCTSGGISVDISLMAVPDGQAADVNTESYDTVNNCDVAAVPGTAGFPDLFTCTLTNADSLAASNYFKIKLARAVADASDTCTGDMEILSIALEWVKS